MQTVDDGKRCVDCRWYLDTLVFKCAAHRPPPYVPIPVDIDKVLARVKREGRRAQAVGFLSSATVAAALLSLTSVSGIVVVLAIQTTHFATGFGYAWFRSRRQERIKK